MIRGNTRWTGIPLSFKQRVVGSSPTRHISTLRSVGAFARQRCDFLPSNRGLTAKWTAKPMDAGGHCNTVQHEGVLGTSTFRIWLFNRIRVKRLDVRQFQLSRDTKGTESALSQPMDAATLGSCVSRSPRGLARVKTPTDPSSSSTVRYYVLLRPAAYCGVRRRPRIFRHEVTFL